MTNDEIVAQILARFKAEAQRYARESDALRNWVGNGNRLPEVYR